MNKFNVCCTSEITKLSRTSPLMTNLSLSHQLYCTLERTAIVHPCNGPPAAVEGIASCHLTFLGFSKADPVHSINFLPSV